MKSNDNDIMFWLGLLPTSITVVSLSFLSTLVDADSNGDYFLWYWGVGALVLATVIGLVVTVFFSPNPPKDVLGDSP